MTGAGLQRINQLKICFMKHSFYLWPGSGYCLDGPFTFDAADTDLNESHLEKLVAMLFEEGCICNYCLTVEEYDDFCRACGSEPSEMDDDLEGWFYVDATMEGAPYPVYLRTENLKHFCAA